MNNVIVFFALLSTVACQQVLQPPYFDIAKGKNISATATCGENYIPRSKDERDELYCTLASVPGKFGVGGLSCSYCIPGDFGSSADGKDSKDHNIRNANDGSNRWWQSPPLSRGLKYREVNVTIDLGQSFHVAYVIIKAANSPRPGIWALERSNDGGKTYSPWHYFAPSSAECKEYFGVDSYLPIVRDNTVLCSTEYSQIPPFQNGEIHISLINGRPGASNFAYSQTLQSWTSATNVRLRLLDIKTLLTDLLPLSLDDPSVTRRYYYSIKDISIGGRCMCNGFADECKPTDIVGQYQCNCQYNSVGPRCSECKEGYVQKKWRPRTLSDKFECEKCNCHGHSDECEYNVEVEQRKLSLDINGIYSGGGVCKDCLHNTHGINCEKCKPFFYRPAGVKITDENACQACNCNTEFSTGLCAEETGQCECKKNFVGRYCDRCNKGYHMFPQCKPCECDVNGSQDGECIPDRDAGCRCKEGYAGFLCNECQPGYFGFPDCRPCACGTRSGAIDNNCDRADGMCRCKNGYDGRQCLECGNGHYEFPYCKDCGCDPRKTVDAICDKSSGVCQCKINFEGPNCERCAQGFYDYPSCHACDCSSVGSISQNCDIKSGQCPCRSNYEGFKCQRCRSGYYGYPQCTSCECNNQGSRSPDCNSEDGQCRCVSPFVGNRCDRCQSGFYGFPDCKQCNCDPSGTKTQPGGNIGDCSSNNDGQCICKQNVKGLECSECKAGYYNLQESNPDGCSGCGCERKGSANGLLSCSQSGQCKCREFVMGSKCIECEDGYYDLKDSNMLGCTGCGCDVGGSEDTSCSKSDGQCACRPNTTGRKCDGVECKYYFPTLHHIRAEIEDGVTPDGDAIRFDYQEKKFPGYTWKGFVLLNNVQSTVIVTIVVPKQSNYQVMFKYVLNQIQPANGQISAYKGNTDQSRLIGGAEFASTQKVVGFTSAYTKVKESNGRNLYFPLASGLWNIKLEVLNSNLYIDHLILLPQEYSTPDSLTKYVQTPCEVKTQEKFCNLYQYVSLDGFVKVEAENPGNARQRDPLPSLFNDTSVLSKLDYKAIVLLTPRTRQLDMLVSVPKPGKYVALIQYYHDSDETKYLDVYLRSRVRIQKGKAWLYKCRYTFGCRQTVLEENFHGLVSFDFKTTSKYLMTFLARQGAVVGLDSITLIPVDEWHMDYVTPKMYCTTKDGKCTTSEYMIPKDSKKIMSDEESNDAVPSYIIDPNVKVMYLRPGSNTIDIPDVTAGRYHVFVHYYQPNHPSFISRSTLYSGSGSGSSGDLDLTFCPNLNGCRKKVKGPGGNDAYVFENGRARFRIDIPAKKDAWIEYILLVPENSVDIGSDDLYKPKPLQLTKDFLEQCALDNYYIKPDATGFCRDSVFSLTTAFNDGALPCKCDSEGSVSSTCECQKFGGQCPCKENVIGRTCTRCKIGYYGFPNCKPCNCSNCDDLTGRCTCPPGVTGENCDRCKSGTFGYDPVIGCQPCNCDKLGTGVDGAVCNVINGKCPCKENYGSRKCSSCAAGYYNFPLCKKCECYSGGVTDEKCNGKTGQCFCQENVVGSQCNECPAGFFKTKDPSSKQLCTKCWCQEKTTKCKEAELYRSSILTATAGWKVSLPNTPVNNVSPAKFEVDLTAFNPQLDSGSPNIIYWIAPKEFLGDQSASYGGELYYHFEYTTKSGETQPLDEIPDVFIKGVDNLVKSNKQVSRSPGSVHRFVVRLHENDWSLEDGSAVTREQMLSVLSKIESLQIRATHDANAGTSTLWNITMDAAVPTGTELIFGIEECLCPSGYSGPSCTECAIGYTIQPDGICGKCECMGRSDVCDKETGACFNCTGNTQGDRCEKCKPAFYGDKCKPCECPSTDPSNNFAESCSIDVSSSELVCQCNDGYAGLKCEKCADGFYGQPNVTGNSCKPCSCNGNINANLTGNCDAVTGKCYKCIDNTDGEQCEKCKPGYYGDAVTERNCKDCSCNLCGSSFEKPCNRTSGLCHCKKNIEGDQCQRCKLNTWNFQACQGCEDCQCGPASESKQCDFKTGRCQCLETVIGKKCDWCKLGFYNYSSTGCQKCACGGKYCDVNTGSCDCGLLGEKCTLCPPGHIIENGTCVECDNCVQNILERINLLITNVSEIEITIIPGSISNSSLDGINATLIRLTKVVDKYGKDLEMYRKAIGFGKYRGAEGDFGFNAVESFRDCEFKSLPDDVVMTTVTTSKDTATSQVLISELRTTAAISTEETTTSANGETTEAFTTELRTTAATSTEDTTTSANDETTEVSTSELSTTADTSTEDTTTFATEETTTEFVIGPIESKTTGSTIFRKRRGAIASPEHCGASLSTVLDNTHVMMNNSDAKITELEEKAYESSQNATRTKERAEDLLKSIQDFMEEFNKIIRFGNATLGGIKNQSTDANSSLAEAEAILKELQERNFTTMINNSTDEKQLALNASDVSKELMKQAMDVEEKAGKFNNTFKDFLQAFRNLKSASRMTNANAENASAIVDLAKTIEYKSLVEEAEKINKQNNVTLEDAMNIYKMAEEAYDAGQKAYNMLNNKTGPLADLMEELREFVASLKMNLDMAQKPVNDSAVHAIYLRDLASKLKALLEDTKKYAEAAIRAAKVYSEIVDAIYEALAAAKMAKNTSLVADVKANDAKADAIEAKQKSEDVKMDADELSKDVEETLKFSLEGIKKRVGELRELRELIQGRIDVVKDELVTFNKEKEIGEKAKNVSERADKALAGAEAGQEVVNRVKDQLAKDKQIVEDLKSNISDINNLIKEVADNVTKVEETIPTLNATIAAVNRQHDDIEETIKNNVTNSIEYVKYLLENARDIANKMPLTMLINKSSELVLPAPENADEPSITNKISLVFATNGSGPLLFIGSDGSTKKKRRASTINDIEANSFMSLEVVDHYVVFRVKLTTSPVNKLVNTLYIEYSNKFQNYYKIVATRNFGYLGLVVSAFDESANEVNHTMVDINSAVVSPLLNLGKNSKFYLGSIPASKSLPPSAFESGREFNGALDDFSFNDKFVGLWYWKESKNIDGAVRAARPSGTGSWCFNGDGYLKIKPDNRMEVDRISVTFATIEPNGLIFLGMQRPTVIDGVISQVPSRFYSLEMQDGFLVSKFNFGTGYKSYLHDRGQTPADDGKPHTFKSKARIRNSTHSFIRFFIDVEKLSGNTYQTMVRFTERVNFNVDEVFIGGVPKYGGYIPNANITTKGFIGCIGNVTVKKLTDTTTNIETGLHYKDGFELPVGRTASFPTLSSYLEVPACSLEPGATFGFVFQTFQKNGAVLHAEGRDASLDMMLVDSQLNVEVVVSGMSVSMASNVEGGLSDGKWHAVSLYLEETSILLYLGTDNGFVKTTTKLPQPEKILLNGNMSLGGMVDRDGFNGNIKQVYCMDREIDLAKAVLYGDAKFGALETLPPIELSPLVTTPKPTTTVSTTTVPTPGQVDDTTPSEVTTESMDSSTSQITNAETTATTIKRTTVEVTTIDTADTTTEVIATTQEPVITDETTTQKLSESTSSTVVTTTREDTTTEQIAETTTEAPTTTEEPTITTDASTTITEAPTSTDEPTITTVAPTTITEAPTTTSTEAITTTNTLTTMATPTKVIPLCNINTPLSNPDFLGFGMSGDGESFAEFSVKSGSLNQKSLFEFFFYTLEPNGILLTTDTGKLFDYEVVYLNNGNIVYVFNAGGGSTPITSAATYNDGKWHKVSTRRSKTSGFMSVDDGKLMEATAPGSQSSVDGIKQVYFGGFPQSATIPGKVPKSSQMAMMGGIKGIKLFDEALTPAVKTGVTDAYNDGLTVANAISIGDKGGYLAKKVTPVGFEFTLSMDVRSRGKKGYIFYASGGGDWLFLRIEEDGKITADCNNGGGSFNVTVDPPKSICDGEFHFISLKKDKKILTLSVDGVTKTYTTEKSSTAANTDSTLYFGGVPAEEKIKNYEIFSGCISSVKVNDSPVDLTTGATIQGACMRGCAEDAA